MDSVRARRSQYLLREIQNSPLNSPTLQSTRVFKYRAVHFAIEFLRLEYVEQRLGSLPGILPDQGLYGSPHCVLSLSRCAYFEYKDRRVTQRNMTYYYLPSVIDLSQPDLILYPSISTLEIAIFFMLRDNFIQEWRDGIHHIFPIGL